MKNKIKYETTLELVFPLFEGGQHSIDEQCELITNKLLLMYVVETAYDNKKLIQFNEKCESENNFDFYSYQSQNMKTNYIFFKPENIKHFGYTSREVSIKSKNELNYNLKLNFVKNFYNLVMTSLVDCETNDKKMVTKLFETWNEFDLHQSFEEAA